MTVAIIPRNPLFELEILRQNYFFISIISRQEITSQMNQLSRNSALEKGLVFNQQMLDRMIDIHERYLRGQPGGRRATFRFIHAEGLDLSQRVLSDADFTGSSFSSAKMIGANFERASLFCADLREVVAENANFGRADLRGATLRGASLAGANLDEADLRRAALARTDLPSGFKLHGLPNGDADRGELAYSVDLTNCSLRRAQLNNSKLRGAKFTGAVLSGASLRGADLAGAVFDGAVMSGVELEGVRLSPGALLNCVLDPSPEAIAKAPDIMQRLAEARLWIATNGKQGSPAVLDDEDLRPLPKVFVDTTLVALSAKRACGIGVDFHGAQLQGANFTGADLRHADFTGADLRGASFANANLLHARFAQADLRPLALDNGGAVNVNLTEAKVSGAAFRESVRA